MGCFGSKPENKTFGSIVMRVNDEATAGECGTVAKILAKSKIVSTNSRKNFDGTVQLSGEVNQAKLLAVVAKCGKEVKLCSWKFGECSRNLQPDRPPYPQGYGYVGYQGQPNYPTNTYGQPYVGHGYGYGGYGGLNYRTRYYLPQQQSGHVRCAGYGYEHQCMN